MRVLRINSLCGIKNQLYCPEQSIGGKSFTGISDGFLDINSLFWSKIFDSQHVWDLIRYAESELSQDQDLKIQAVLNAPERFFATYQEAVKIINATPRETSPIELFQATETLEVICKIHSHLNSAPFILTLPQGYIHSKYSALDLERTCLLPFCNPYLDFIQQDVIPSILSYQPDILILTGTPNLPAFAIAKLAREAIPDLFIVAADHESDYFSLEKISDLLVRNSAFFSVYHCVVLRSSPQTESRLKEWKKQPLATDLNSIPNLIYSLNGGNTIVKTAEVSLPDPELVVEDWSKDFAYNLKLFSQNHCYWNRCSFCGINSKYGNSCNERWDISDALYKIRRLCSRGITRFWFLDEAIPATALKSLAEQLTTGGIDIMWHVRTRIEPAFSTLAKILAAAGLRHIIFGLESASKRVLTLMQKTNGDFDYLETAEQIVKTYTAESIQVHFSIIFGFPTETEEDRHETILFLTYLQQHYTLFSYNINSFYLDIGSEIYRRWENYDITSLSFPCTPKYFLENHLDWNNAVSPDRVAAIQNDKDLLMMRQYNWYPEGALIRPDVFFAFWEFGRFSLWKEGSSRKKRTPVLDKNKAIAFSPMVSFCQLLSGSWLIYHLKSHHFVVGGAVLHDLLESAQVKSSFSSFFLRYKGPYKAKAEELVSQLLSKGFFV